VQKEREREREHSKTSFTYPIGSTKTKSSFFAFGSGVLVRCGSSAIISHVDMEPCIIELGRGSHIQHFSIQYYIGRLGTLLNGTIDAFPFPVLS